ncbi:MULTISPECIES: hypothetical protein [unclassified Rhizobium]|uniref:hypothetical protein n=1 Tax=unclassified Rhizobium TaxID=2613769 RepID=UPI001469CDBB|nr:MULTISPECIES: hypothetical protein [unclassified Rhizobium]MBD9450317.1 hypothetical protein [Rhizobium sp. RHZ02]NMN71896.1 hypothetical protein [Rhizobium sp. 57MFTsu3.2]
MNRALAVAAIGEIVTGLALVAIPALVGELLLGEALVGVAAAAARVAGIALIGLGIACWRSKPLEGMLSYSILVTFYLAYLGLAHGMTGILLWPAVVLHAVLSLLLARIWWGGAIK